MLEDNDKTLQTQGTDKTTNSNDSQSDFVNEVRRMIVELNNSEVDRILAIKAEQNATREEFNIQTAQVEGEKIGFAKGKRVTQVEIIKKMLSKGFSIDDIAGILDMQVEEITELLK